MRSNTLIRITLVLVIILPISSCLIITDGNGEEKADPLINSVIGLERISPQDVSPAVLRLSIPVESGEPVISNLSYRISDGEWINLPDWKEIYSTDGQIASMTFPVDIAWGDHQTIFVRIVDLMGSCSMVGCPLILSRPPSVDLISPLSDIDDPIPGEYTFEASISDPDGQDVDCLWKVDGEAVTCGRTFTTYLEEGIHSITVEATDGQWMSMDAIHLEIKADDRDELKNGIDIVWIISLSFLLLVIVFLLLFIAAVIHSFYSSRRIVSSVSGSTVEIKSSWDLLDCDICLKALNEGHKTTKCRCGAQFHKGCGKKEGVCPECGREILI
jgi:hypothetical protein